jgi:hypothetical protein
MPAQETPEAFAAKMGAFVDKPAKNVVAGCTETWQSTRCVFGAIPLCWLLSGAFAK